MLFKEETRKNKCWEEGGLKVTAVHRYIDSALADPNL